MRKKYFVASLASIALFLLCAFSAQAYTFDFKRISYNSTANVQDQLSVDVSEILPLGSGGSSQVSFIFHNVGDISSIIGSAFFDDSGFLGSILSIVGSSGVSFTNTGNKNFPEGTNLTPSFHTDFSATFSGGQGGANNGVNNSTNDSEWLTIIFSLSNEKTYSDVIAALGNGNLRIGLHVQGLSDGGSDAYVNTVPIPAAAWLLGSGLVGLMGIRMRRKQR